MVKSVYIHIPFCKSKCHYCSFISFCKIENKKDYLQALYEEIKNSYHGELLETVYFGGGTPSILTIPEFAKLLNFFKTSKKTEITTELNPDDMSYDYLRALYDLGINRDRKSVV